MTAIYVSDDLEELYKLRRLPLTSFCNGKIMKDYHSGKLYVKVH